MGVQGLDVFLDDHRRIYRDIEFRMSQLVVDGSNLIPLLYYNSGLDQTHGGEYAAFEALIERFIAALTTCEVTPYVVLDGGSDLIHKKLEIVTKRAEDQIKKAHQAAVEGRKKNILPPLAKQVFKQTLAQLKVPMAQCYGDADREIAALASEWNCPVLSGDSDFYIFDLPAGLLPFCYFQWKNVKEDGSQSFITCKTYHISRFSTVFKIQQQLLPTFAVLGGNDYVNLQRIRWTQFAPSESKTPSHLEGLLCWLKGFQQPQEALEAALVLMEELSKNSKTELLQNLSVGMEEYQLPSSSLKGFFHNGVTPEVVGPIHQVPDRIRLQLMQARLTPDVLDVLLLKRMSLSITVGHKNQPSVNLTSRPLRQVMYGLLLGEQRPVPVEERDREELKLTFILVKPIFSRVAQELKLSSLHEAKLSERLQVLLEALGVTEATLNDLPPQLRLPVAVTCYWLRRAQPPPDLKLAKALLLGMSNEDALRARADLQAEHPNGKPNLDVAHAFSQWQVCLKDSIQLNQLLGFPLPEPDVARLYQGTLVHQLVPRLTTGGRVKAFLGSGQSSVKQYHAMLSIIQQFHAREESTPSETRQRAAARRHPLNDLTANEEDSSAVRVHEELVNQVSVRTRYRTKERRNRSNNPELVRKEECQGQDFL
uniref:Asteroid homolog 1 n=1 Tax=Amphiprion percula TaxID=161767 RepID=A0A3P8TVG9_AMPPE